MVLHGGSSLAMPVNEQIRITLTLQVNPLSGKIYAAGFYRVKGSTVYGTNSNQAWFVAESSDEHTLIRRQFLEALFAELNTLHQYNQPLEWRDQKSLQIYVFDGYEAQLLEKLLLEAMVIPELAPLALLVLLYCQNPNQITADEQANPQVPFPVIVLTQVIRQLVALPQPLTLRLPEVVDALPASNFQYNMTPNTLFWFELSNTMKSDAIMQAWTGKCEAIDWVKCELEKRLFAASAVVDGLRERVAAHLFAWPPKFEFPETMCYQQQALSQLSFIIRYESFMSAIAVRQLRTAPWADRVRDAVSIPLRYCGADRWELLSELDSSQIEADSFFDYLLVPAGKAGERAQMGYNDYWSRKARWSPKSVVRVTSMGDVVVNEDDARITEVSLKSIENKQHKPFKIGDEAVLHRRFTDFTSDKIIDRLEASDTQPDDHLLSLINDPNSFNRVVKLSKSLIRNAIKNKKQAEFTDSQSSAFIHCLHNRLTLVWGPPGTGKTHFLAKTVLCLFSAYQKANKPFRVGVTAFTHAAVENLLLQIQGFFSVRSNSQVLDLYKLKKTTTLAGENLNVIIETKAGLLNNDRGVLLGGTVYSLQKAWHNGYGISQFDLLIVDEASQMKFGELALALMARL